ncbi:MAG: GFA family protein [Proteobacteria bacterium]|nr:GFA family protein [Pseudomonadota bacterium]
MQDTKNFSSRGQCLCGGVRFHATAANGDIGMCHCKMCRRWAGGLPLTVLNAQVTLQAEDTLTWWKGSSWGERGFCNACGCSLFWRAVDMPESWAVSVGALEEENALTLSKHIFYDDKAAFYHFTDDAPKKTGAEFTAKIMRALGEEHGATAQKQALAQCRLSKGDVFTDEVEKFLTQ